MPDYAARRTLMVDTQVRPSDVTKFPIIDAMLRVPRERFVPAGREEAAYVGEHLPLASERVLLEPRTFAKMLDALLLAPEHVVLDVGCGLGYSAAVVARLAEAVVAVEDSAERVAEAERLLADTNADNVAVVEAPLAEGAAKHGPYDVILVQGGVEAIPDTLTAQLNDGGRIVAIFETGKLGTVRVGHYINGEVSWRYAFNADAPLLTGFERARDFVF